MKSYEQTKWDGVEAAGSLPANREAFAQSVSPVERPQPEKMISVDINKPRSHDPHAECN